MSRTQEAGGRQEVGGRAIGRAGRDKCIDLTDSRYLMPSVTVVYFVPGLAPQFKVVMLAEPCWQNRGRLCRCTPFSWSSDNSP